MLGHVLRHIAFVVVATAVVGAVVVPLRGWHDFAVWGVAVPASLTAWRGVAALLLRLS